MNTGHIRYSEFICLTGAVGLGGEAVRARVKDRLERKARGRTTGDQAVCQLEMGRLHRKTN